MKCSHCGYIQSDRITQCKACGGLLGKTGSLSCRPQPSESLIRALGLPALLCLAIVVFIGTHFGGEKPRFARSAAKSERILAYDLCAAAAAEQGAAPAQIETLCRPAFSPKSVRERTHTEQTDGRAARASREPAPAADAAYEDARKAVGNSDYESAIAAFEEAVNKQNDFTEAWYNMGAARARLAIEQTRSGNEMQAVETFRSAVTAKRKAKELIARNIWYKYRTPEQQAQVISDLENGLADADAVLTDEPSLKQALRLWAAAGIN